jgi:outer membrane protein TolC
MRALHGMPSRRRGVLARGFLGLVMLVVAGCGRPHYRARADRDVDAIERERMFDARWRLPARPVEADRRSRLRDPADPDAEPIPPDDPAARRFQVSAAYPHEFHGWKRRGTAPVEDLSWRCLLPREPDGTVLLDRASVMQLALIHSRDYQFQFEDLYLTALFLTLARFEFAVQGFSRGSLFFQHFGAGATDSNQLQINTDSGFFKNFASGAQLFVDFANALVFEYNGRGFNTASSALNVALTQPLLRGALARIRTQNLSLQERVTLYALRDFARFRRVFYVETVAAGGYLGLLLQLQGIRNSEANLATLRRNLEESEALLKASQISTLQRDQVAQQFQAAQVALIQARAGLQTQLDRYKIGLGLPPDLLVKLDDSILGPFQLNDPRLDGLRARNDALALSLLQYDAPPPSEILKEAGRQLLAEYADLEAVLAGALDEARRFRREAAGPGPDQDHDAADDRAALADRLVADLQTSRRRAADDVATARKLLAGLDWGGPDEEAAAFDGLVKLTSNEFRGRHSEVFVAQTQARVHLIRLTPVDLPLEEAISVALANRQDLMNDLGRVTDAWRNVEVAANALKGFVNLNYQGSLRTDPAHDGILRLDASQSTHRVGVSFDAPINRRAERNQYRANQIAYQRARRRYMLTHDTILQEVRQDLRQIDLSGRQFEIGREQLIIASRQVEEAEAEFRNPPPNAGGNIALNLTTALNNRLDARNSLIQSWVGYETARMSLFRDLDIMIIDSHGVWANETSGTDGFPRCDRGAEGPGAAVDETRGRDGDPEKPPAAPAR